MPKEWTIGQLSARTGLPVSAIRHYEKQGIVSPERTAGNQRRYPRSDLRRLSFVIAAKRIGKTLPEIRALLDALPQGRTPSRADWAQISAGMQAELDARIAELTRLRDTLDGCIGCGCLSLDRCALYNPDDCAGALGAGPRYAMGDSYRTALEKGGHEPPA